MSYQETTCTWLGAVVQIDDHGLGGIEQGAEAHADDVGGNDLIGVVAEGLGGLQPSC